MKTAHQEDGAKAVEQGIKEEAVWEVGRLCRGMEGSRTSGSVGMVSHAD
jgi:hypothetical protein